MGRKLLLGLLLLAPLGFYPLLRDKRVEVIANPVPAPPDQTLVDDDPAKALEKLAKDDPVKFLDHCLARSEKEVTGYRCLFLKQERVNDKLNPYEKIRIHFREKPFSVHMDWLEGEGLCKRCLYIDGENGGNVVVRGLLFGIEAPILVRRPVWAADAKATSRFPITKFGMYLGAQETLASIHVAQEKKSLHLKYLGQERVEKLGDRMCYKLVRMPFVPPEGGLEQLNEITIYIDRTTLMQVGSILKNAKGELIAEYFFRDVELNPTFEENQFTEKSL